jgi:hypothetical protein
MIQIIIKRDACTTYETNVYLEDNMVIFIISKLHTLKPFPFLVVDKVVI